MFDPLLTLLAAKAKAVGLVAGTAVVTAALAGGGAVAMTAVSHEGEVEDTAAVEEQSEVDSDAALAALLDPAPTSDTGTVGIDPEVSEPDVTTDLNADGLADETGLPVGFVCDDSKNHGQNVSSFASTHKGPGHGKLVSAIAKSDCGKTASEEEAEEEAEEELTTESTEAEDAEQAEQAEQTKAEKKAEKKAAKKDARAEKKAGKGKPAGSKGGKGGGKGGGRG